MTWQAVRDQAAAGAADGRPGDVPVADRGRDAERVDESEGRDAERVDESEGRDAERVGDMDGGGGTRVGAVLRFGLECGSYATMLLRELAKAGTAYPAPHPRMLTGPPHARPGPVQGQ
jgi:tRNA(Glu) U13 pseudouridine synthase TruD